MRSIAIDIGNTRIKAGLFENAKLLMLEQDQQAETIIEWCSQQQASHAIIASVSGAAGAMADALSGFLQVLVLNANVPLPLSIRYKTPQTLGVDRIAAAVGGAAMFPATPVLIFDAGTCLTHEVVNAAGEYLGGAISPGLQMRLKSMHNFTARLPLASLDATEVPPLPGQSTEECLQAGAFWGMLGEIEGLLLRYRQVYPQIKVILCGGDAKIFENKLKEPIFVVPELVLFGLNEILQHHVLQKKNSAPTL